MSNFEVFVKVHPHVPEPRFRAYPVADGIIGENVCDRTAGVLVIGIRVFPVNVENNLPDRRIRLKCRQGDGGHHCLGGV
ncbi:hypothetical protein D9M70_648300 [compost metagenome]